MKQRHVTHARHSDQHSGTHREGWGALWTLWLRNISTFTPTLLHVWYCSALRASFCLRCSVPLIRCACNDGNNALRLLSSAASTCHGKFEVSWTCDACLFLFRLKRRLYCFGAFLSASLYFSKRGAYWDRLCRDVVGRWLVGWLSRACTVAKRCILGL